MDWKKNVNTNLGITILLMAGTILVLAFFLVMSYELNDGFLFTRKTDDTNIPSSEGVIDIMDNDTALEIGNEKYVLACDLLFHPIFTVETDNNSDVKYILDNDNFVVTSEWQKGIYFKVSSGIEFYTNIFSNNMMNQLFKYSNGNYYSDTTPSGGRGKRIDYISTDLNVVEISDNSILFDAVSSYYTNTDDIINDVSIEDAEIKTESNLFEIVLNNGEWKVNNFTIPY